MYKTRYSNSIPHLDVKFDYVKNFFLPPFIKEWSNVHSNKRNSENYALFKISFFAFKKASGNSTLHCYNFGGLKVIEPPFDFINLNVASKIH